MTGYALLIPEFLLLGAAVWALFSDRLRGGDKGAATAGALAAGVGAVIAALSPVGEELFGGALVFDGPARFARAGVAVATLAWMSWTAGRGEGRTREATALALLSTIGAMLMVGANDLVTLVLAVELTTLPSYALIGYRKSRVAGLEGALKYFLLSMMTSLVMLYGFSFLYGMTGETRLALLRMPADESLAALAVLLSFVGLFAKLSAAPFHYWAPDAYEGAEPWSVAFVSTVPKIAGAVALVRLALALAPTVPFLGTMILVAAVASMVLGNLAALTQTDVRRMMAYSGVAHAGYLMLGAATLTTAGGGAAVLYAVAYALPSVGIMLLTAEVGPSVADFAGLSKRRPWAAWSAVVMLVSLIGIPPLIGFFGKFSLFASAIDAGLVPWVAVAVTLSVVSAGYYLRIVRASFFAESAEGEPAEREPFMAAFGIIVCVVAAVVLGLAAGPVVSWLGTPLL